MVTNRSQQQTLEEHDLSEKYYIYLYCDAGTNIIG